MRFLAAIGALAAFLAVAYVPPTAENLHANALPIATVAADAKQNQTLQAISAILRPVADVLRSKLSGGAAVIGEYAGQLTSAAIDVGSTQGQVLIDETKKHVVTEVKNTVTEVISESVANVATVMKPAKKKPVAQLLTPSQRVQFTPQLNVIDTAVATSDVRVCQELKDVENRIPDAALAPTVGDFLAFCIARITKDAHRCPQINDQSSVPLREMCEREVAAKI